MNTKGNFQLNKPEVLIDPGKIGKNSDIILAPGDIGPRKISEELENARKFQEDNGDRIFSSLPKWMERVKIKNI
jgi:hypothetical protein